MKLVLILKMFLNVIKIITHLEVIIENIQANIILIMLFGNFIFSMLGKNLEQTSK